MNQSHNHKHTHTHTPTHSHDTYLRDLQDLRHQHMSARSDQVKDHILTSNDQKSPRHAKNKLYAKEIEEMERQYQQQQQHQQRQQQLQGSQRERREYSSNDDEESFLSYDSVPESQQRSQSQSPLQQRKRKMLRINPGKVFRHTKAMMFKTHNRSDDDGDGGCNGDFRDHDNVIPSSHHPSENSHNHNHNHNHNHTNSTPLRRRFSRGDSNKNHKWNSTSNTNPTAIQLHHLHSKEQQQQELQLRSGTASLAPSQRTTTTTGTSSSATTSLYPLPPPNPFTIPPGTKLSPRADLWLLLVLACAVSVGSLADASSPSSSSLFGSGSWNGGGQERSSDEKLALVLSSLAFLISTFVAVAYRYGPTRFHLTRGKGERLVSLGLLALVVAGTGIVMTASGGGGGGTGSGNYGSHGDYIAVTANSIWNTNLFYSQWTVLFTVGYIAGDLLTTENHFGTVSKDYVPTNHIARLWFVFLLAAVSMGGVSSNLVNGPLCQGTYLKQTTLCSNALAAAVLGFLNFVLGLLALGVYRLEVIGGDRMPYYFNVTRLPMKWFDGRANCRRTCHRISSLLASAGLILASVGVALVSAPGGPGTETNSVFVTTWTVFATSFLLVKKHVEEAMGWSPRYDAPSSVPVESVLPGKPLSSSRGGPRRHRHARDGSIRSAASRATTVASNLDECSQDDDYSCEEEEDMVDPFDGMAGGPVDGLHRGDDDDYDDDDESGAEDVVGESQEDFHGSDESPFVTTSDAATAVSSLGQSRFTKEPSGVKAGLSHYGGVDAAAGYQNPHPNREQPQGSFSIPNGYNARQPQEAPPEAYGGGGGRMDATGSKLPKQQSFYGGVNASNLYPQQRAWSQDVDSVGCSTQSGTGMMYSHPPPPQQHPQPPPPPPGNPGFYRRNSRTSYASASNLSPLREGSREGSRTSSSSATRTTSTEKGSQSSRSRSRSSSNQRGGRRVPPPPIDSNRYLNPHPPSVSTVDTESLPMTDDGELSASRGPSTVDNSRQSPARSRPPPPSSRRLDEHIRATSMDNNQASDFDILISESSTVVTELTNDGFDAGATPSSSRGFPPSNPLYNISRGGRNGAGSGSGSGGYQDPTSPVDELVASALAHARRSRNHDSGTAEIFTDDEESHLGGGGGGGVTYHGGGISSGRSNSRPKSRERKERRQTPNTTHSSGGKKRGSGKTKRQHPQHPGRANNFGDSNQSAAAASTSTSKSGKGCRNHRGSIQSNFSSLMNDFPPDEMGDYVC